MLIYLREQTTKWHKEAEKHNIAKHIVDHSITLKDYKALITQYYLIYGSVYMYLDLYKNRSNTFQRAFLNKEKVLSLQKDLVENKLEIPILRSPEKLRLLPISEHTLNGVLYTIEGSMLGRALIGKKIKGCPTLSEINDFHFFQMDTKSHMKDWKEFCSYLNSLSINEEQKNQVLEASITTFKLFMTNNTKI